jgi:amidase
MHDLIDLPVRKLLALMHSRETSSEEICTAFLARIESSSIINAVVHVDAEEVLAQARSADRNRRSGNDSPLLGIPFSVKDSIAVADWPWRSGSYARENIIADKDATAVSRLRAAGGIPICKTATPEYTWSAQTHSELHGRTNNPYDLERSPGGSSGGEAALHAVHGAPFGLGSDGFNSIRVPAHFCGTAGLRPTAGVVSEAGTWPTTKQTGMGDISTIGPMGRYAEDLDLILDLIAGVDPEDPFVHPLVRQRQSLKRKRIKVGVLPSSALKSNSPRTRMALEVAAQTFQDQGAELVEISPWDSSLAVDLAFGLMAPDGGALVRINTATAQGRHTEEFGGLLESLRSKRSTIDQYLEALKRLKEYRGVIRRTVSEIDVALVPVASGPAPLHDRLPGSDSDDYDVEAFAQAFAIALSGLPSCVVPTAMEGHLPVGVQLVGNPHHDFEVLLAAQQLQSSVAGNITQPNAWKQS